MKFVSSSTLSLAILSLCLLSVFSPYANAELKEDPTALEELSEQLYVFEKLPPDMRTDGKESTGRVRWIINNTWRPGTTLKVAFNGGNPKLHKLIAETAQEWSRYGNIKFDFGFDPKLCVFRLWSPDDKNYSADIRIAFEPDGHWSALGTMSTNKSIYPPNEKSMNLNLAVENAKRWKGVILHEFGHALGFGHEHQHPLGQCDREFRWDDDTKYDITWRWVGPNPEDIVYLPDRRGNRPGLYTYMIGFPNKWTAEGVDAQMRSIPKSEAYKQGFELGPVDRKSIMHYAFESAFFKKGEQSPCHVVEANKISELDKKGMAASYPFSKAGR